METLEIELAYIQQLMEDEVLDVLQQYHLWEVLQDCALVFDIDVSNIKDPCEVLPDLVMSKADERFSEPKAERFKAVWQGYTPLQQMHIMLRASQQA